MRETVDFHHVPPQQTAIHERLRNWSRWVRVRPHGWQTHPMFRNAKTPRTLDVDAHIHVECDTLDALLIERTGKMGLTGPGIQCMREMCEWHDLQRKSISRAEYDRHIKATVNRIKSGAPEVTDVLETA